MTTCGYFLHAVKIIALKLYISIIATRQQLLQLQQGMLTLYAVSHASTIQHRKGTLLCRKQKESKFQLNLSSNALKIYSATVSLCLCNTEHTNGKRNNNNCNSNNNKVRGIAMVVMMRRWCDIGQSSPLSPTTGHSQQPLTDRCIN